MNKNKPVEITKDIYWTGVQNPDLRIFDVIMRTDHGTSYNSYLVKGSEKTAVIDAVKEGFSDEQIERLSAVCDVSAIDYIICNHVEPDHSGGLWKLLKLAPKAIVLCSKPASVFLRNILNTDFECRIVEDGDTVELGGKTLKFISAPFLHWPDSIFTYATEDAILFSGDVFGFHYSSEEIFDDNSMQGEAMLESQKYYFDVIMSPFKKYVLDAVKKVQPLHTDVICPSHGPVLRSSPKDTVERYKEWASDILEENDPKKVYIAYVSCYGYTKMLAERILKVVTEAGFDAEMQDIIETDIASCAKKIHAADAFAIGSPTINRDALKPAWDVLTSISTYVVKGKIAASFGSFGWSGESIKYLSERLRDVGADVVGSCSAKLRPDEKELAEAEKLGKTICDALAVKK